MILAGTGVFLLGMAVLQAWPGRGFWQGTAHGQPGTLAGMTSSMAGTPQPDFLSGWVNAFTSFDEAHGFAVNLFAVVVLAVIGAAFLTGQRRLARPAVIAFTVLCLADWVLIEDFGFFGGLGTDPNSMIPFAFLAVSGYLALNPGPAPAAEPATAKATAEPASPAAAAEPAIPAAAAQPLGGELAGPGPARLAAPGTGHRQHRHRRRYRRARADHPRCRADGRRPGQPERRPNPGRGHRRDAAPLNFPAKPFQLTDQHGHTVSLASLRGKVVLLTFLDPVCTSDCPLIAQEFRAAGQLLGADARHVELVAVVANPIYHEVAFTQAFDRQERLTQVPNWLYLTGSVPQLRQVWRDYGISALILPAGSMIGHPDIAYVIDRAGRVRAELSTDPGPGTTATKSSFAVLLANAARNALRSS